MTSDKDEPSSSTRLPQRSATRVLREGVLWVTFFSALAVPLSFLRSLLLADIDEDLFLITTEGDVTLIGQLDHQSKGLAFAPLRSSGP